MSERFNVLICKFYKFYICAVVGIIIEFHCRRLGEYNRVHHLMALIMIALLYALS